MATNERAKGGAFRFGGRAAGGSKADYRKLADSIGRYALLAGAALAMILVAPTMADAHQFPKYAVFAVFLSVAGIAWALARLRGGEVRIGKMAWVPALALAAATVVAALSGNWAAWLGGPDRLPFSFSIVLVLSLAVFLCWQYLDASWLPRIRAGLSAAFGLLSAIFLARTFLPLPPVFPNVGLSLFSASASDIAIVSAVSTVVALQALFEDGRGKVHKTLYAISGLLSLAVLALVGLPLGWAASLVGSAGLFALAFRSVGWKDWRTIVAAALLVVSIPLSIFGTPAAARLAIPPEVRLGLADSYRVAESGLASGPKAAIVGAGFGGYPAVFALHRPAWLNATDMFSAVSVQPYGALPYLAAEGGALLALVALAIALALLAAAAVVVFRAGRQTGKAKAMAKGFPGLWPAIALVMLVVSAFFAVPSFALLTVGALCFAAMSIYASGPQIESRKLVGAWGKAATIAFAVALLAFGAQTARVALAQHYFGQALKAYSDGRVQDSLGLVGRSAAIDPDPRYLLGIAQAKTRLAAASPQDAGLRAAAVAALKDAERQPLPTLDYRVTLGNTAAQLSKDAASDVSPIVKESLEAAVAGSPDNPALRLWAGDMEFAIGDSAAAISEYAEAERLRPAFTQALVHHAQLLSLPGATEDRDQALTLLKQAFESSPQDKEVLGMFVSAAADRGKPEDIDMALAALLAYLRSYPNDSQVISTYASIAAAHGRTDDARSAYARVLELNPDDADAKAALDKLGPAAATSTPAR